MESLFGFSIIPLFVQFNTHVIITPPGGGGGRGGEKGGGWLSDPPLNKCTIRLWILLYAEESVKCSLLPSVSAAHPPDPGDYYLNPIHTHATRENKKQLHHCISAIGNRTSISLNIINEHDHNQQAFVSDDKSINEHFASQYIAQHEIRINDYFRLRTLKLVINGAARK